MANMNLLRKSYSAVFIAPRDEQNVREYAERRNKILEKLDGPAFFMGVGREPGTEEDYVQTWCKLIQDPAFIYLTGVNQPGCFLLLDPEAENDERVVLYVPKKDTFKEFWTGLKLGIGPDGASEVSDVTGIKCVRPAENFWKEAKAVVKKSCARSIGVFFGPDYEGDHNRLFAKKMDRLAASFGKSIENVAKKHFELRLPLESVRVESVKKAEKATGDAFVECIKNMHAFKTERDFALALDYGMQRRSDGDLAFPTIAACGENACCLHYVKNDEPLVDGKLLLLDFGVRSETQCSDISRTVPISGKYSPLQKIVYNAVLAAQEFHQKQVKPGECLKNLDKKVWEFLYNELELRFKAVNGGFELLYDKRPHGVSHFIGEQVHEASIMGRMLDIKLAPGMLISNEPGAYGTFFAVIDGVRYEEKIGIRIEDDLLVTEDGCKNLSIEIPKTIEDIEKMMNA